MEEDEIEMMENIFDALCSVVSEPEGKTRFLQGEGLELMILMMKTKKMARIRAVKVIDHALLTPQGQPLAHRFIEAMGLKTLFAAFMKKGIKAYKKEYKSFSEKEEEGMATTSNVLSEHIMSIIVSLFKHADTIDSQLRLLAKFLELEKMDRLMEMHFAYSDRMAGVKATETGDEDQDYLDRLEAGLFTLQLVDLVILSCIALEHPETVNF